MFVNELKMTRLNCWIHSSFLRESEKAVGRIPASVSRNAKFSVRTPAISLYSKGNLVLFRSLCRPGAIQFTFLIPLSPFKSVNWMVDAMQQKYSRFTVFFVIGNGTVIVNLSIIRCIARISFNRQLRERLFGFLFPVAPSFFRLGKPC